MVSLFFMMTLKMSKGGFVTQDEDLTGERKEEGQILQGG